MVSKMEQLESQIRTLEAELSKEYELEKQRELERLEVAEKAKRERLQAEAEARERKRQAPLLDALAGMREQCEKEERLRAGTEPLPPAEPLTCFAPITEGKFANTGLCTTFLAGGPQLPDLCGQCEHGFKNATWLAGIIHREKARIGF